MGRVLMVIREQLTAAARIIHDVKHNRCAIPSSRSVAVAAAATTPAALVGLSGMRSRGRTGMPSRGRIRHIHRADHTPKPQVPTLQYTHEETAT
eukprot:1644498-Rhodomonas_salina.2